MQSSSAAAMQSDSLVLASGATVTEIADEDTMSSNSATKLATQQSIKAYADTTGSIRRSERFYPWASAGSSILWLRNLTKHYYSENDATDYRGYV